MTNNNINPAQNSAATYRSAYIASVILFAVIYALSMVFFNLVSYQVSGLVLNMLRAGAIIAAIVCAFITCVRCAQSNKLRNPDIYTPPRDTFYYIKRMGFFVLMIILISFAASLLGMFTNSILIGVFSKIQNAFFSEFFMKLPVFIIYLVIIYKMLVRYGFMDSERKIFNPNFKLLTFIIAFMIMLPGLIYADFFHIPALINSMMDVQTVLSPNVGTYIIESDGYTFVNENFGAINVILIAVTSLLTFAIQTAVFMFAYNRGKKIFIKEHIREVNEYEMNENI